MVAMANAARDGCAAAIRANSPQDVAAIKEGCGLPVIGIWKKPGFRRIHHTLSGGRRAAADCRRRYCRRRCHLPAGRGLKRWLAWYKSSMADGLPADDRYLIPDVEAAFWCAHHNILIRLRVSPAVISRFTVCTRTSSEHPIFLRLYIFLTPIEGLPGKFLR